MKRTKTIIASDQDSRVEVTIKIDARPTLLRGEVSEMTDDLTSAIMAQMPTIRYLHIPLCKVKVR